LLATITNHNNLTRRCKANFGAAFAGLGVGLPRTRQYCHFYGGKINVSSLFGEGTDAVVHLNRLGDA